VTPNRPHFDALIERCRTLPPLPVAVVCPEDQNSMEGALSARDEGLIAPVFVGDPARITQTASEIGVSIGDIEIIEADGEAAAAGRAVELVHEGRAHGLMKGNIHSDTYLSAIVKSGTGLRTDRRTSHCFVMDIPGWPKPVIITDAALNIDLKLSVKTAIIRNAIDFAHALGLSEPRVALLSAVELANPAMPSSLDAAHLAELARNGEFSGALVDGPFALDNAVSEEAARIKGITSPVAGQADVLVVPSIEAGNILFKALTFMAGSESAGLVVGASVPVVLTSRADSAMARLASCALAVLYQDYLQKQT
jgi:phosphotransacetylase